MGITVSIGEESLSASDVKTLYESNSDTNAFTDSEKTKLSNQSGTNTGDEVAATESVAGIAEILTQAEADAGSDDTRFLTALKAKNTRGIEGLFLEVTGQIGGGPGWSDAGFISLFPVNLFAASSTERSIYMFFGLSRVKFDVVDPQVGFIVYSTAAPSSGEAVRWQLTAKYIADGDSTAAPAAETLLQTQVFTTLVADSRQTTLFFTLDRTLIADQDAIHLNLERLGGDGADTYGGDIGVGQAGIIAETTKHDP